MAHTEGTVTVLRLEVELEAERGVHDLAEWLAYVLDMPSKTLMSMYFGVLDIQPRHTALQASRVFDDIVKVLVDSLATEQIAKICLLEDHLQQLHSSEDFRCCRGCCWCDRGGG